MSRSNGCCAWRPITYIPCRPTPKRWRNIAWPRVEFPALRQVATFSDLLRPETRAACREAWGVPVADTYSSAEAALSSAAAGCEVIVNALNPPYTRWRHELPRLTANVITAAKSSGATVMIPGNVYHYGAAMPARLAEDTPAAPTTRKGRLRAEMERAYEQASAEGVRTIILRAGDFIERQRTGNWFDSHTAADVGAGRVMYPGPLDRLHAWAYLPDMARAIALLADKRAGFAAFEEFGFPGYALTGRMLIDAMAGAAGGA